MLRPWLDDLGYKRSWKAAALVQRLLCNSSEDSLGSFLDACAYILIVHSISRCFKLFSNCIGHENELQDEVRMEKSKSSDWLGCAARCLRHQSGMVVYKENENLECSNGALCVLQSLGASKRS